MKPIPNCALSMASRLCALAHDQQYAVITVESCTGGMLGGSITAVSGSSQVYLGGWVTYHNQAKRALAMGLPTLEQTMKTKLQTAGAVSHEVAALMAMCGYARGMSMINNHNAKNATTIQHDFSQHGRSQHDGNYEPLLMFQSVICVTTTGYAEHIDKSLCGTLYVGICDGSTPPSTNHSIHTGDRTAIRTLMVEHALKLTQQYLEQRKNISDHQHGHH